MKYPKFILTDSGHLRLGEVALHRDLLQYGEQCMGGGFYHFDYVGNRLVLDRESYDYGPPKWHLFDEIHVEALYRGMDIVYQSGDRYEPDLLLNRQMTIIYD